MKALFAWVVLFLDAANGAPACPSSELPKIGAILTGPDMTKCAADSGVALNPAALPNHEQIVKMCAAPSCLQALTAMEAASPANCDVIPGVNVKSLIGDVKKDCASIAATMAPATTAPTTTATTAPPASTKPPQKPSQC